MKRILNTIAAILVAGMIASLANAGEVIAWLGVAVFVIAR